MLKRGKSLLSLKKSYSTLRKYCNTNVQQRKKFRRANIEFQDASKCLEKAEQFESDCDVKSAVFWYQQASKLNPSDPRALLRLSKCTSDQVFLPTVSETRAAKRYAEQALRLSRKAIELHSQLSEAYVCHATNLGRLSIFSDNKEKVKMAGEIYTTAVEALRLDPDSDLAAHVLGRWEHEMASIGPLLRIGAKMLYGDLGDGCFQKAIRHYEQAIERRPERLIHRVALAKTLMKVNKKEEAISHLKVALDLKIEDINARCERADGISLLKSVGYNEAF
ncbi:hypothetical protein CYMTET_9580 [Cymbomonas tetramitiformis]|uniref:Uncharacterized protein n=1 Tax=Cymbomonas tetramitiformis TaxID=36881 RepID=A0AAE0LFB9_9CHLO|nr:hypothetical protein CYMTET_9580 [Cymbomonas tetramitiformis]